MWCATFWCERSHIAPALAGEIYDITEGKREEKDHALGGRPAQLPRGRRQLLFVDHSAADATPQAAQERSRERRENGVFTRATHA